MLDHYVAVVAALYVSDGDMDQARRRLAEMRSDNTPMAILSARDSPPGRDPRAKEWNRLNISRLYDDLPRDTPLPRPAATPGAVSSPIEPQSEVGVLNVVAALAALVAMALLIVGASALLRRAQGDVSPRSAPNAGTAGGAPPSRRARDRRAEPPPPATEGSGPGDKPAVGESRQPPTWVPTGSTVGVGRPASPGAGRRQTGILADGAASLRAQFRHPNNEYEELLPVADRETGALIGGCGVSHGITIPAPGADHHYATFVIWIQDENGRGWRSVCVVTRWAWQEKRQEIEEWTASMELDGIEVAREGRIRQFETGQMRVEICLDEVETGSERGLPRGSFFTALTVRFEVIRRPNQ